MTFGVTPQGFVRKRLPDLLAEIEADNVATFGPGVIQTAASPLGQMNGIFAEIEATLWEMAEAVYQSNDPDQTEGVNLDRLARLRNLSRSGQADKVFRPLITNAAQTHLELSDIAAQVASVTGVTFVYASVNEGHEPNADGIPPQHVSVAVIGGADAAVATAIRSKIAPGVGTWGATLVESVIDGFVRPVRFTRPEGLLLSLRVGVRETPYRRLPEPPTTDAIEAALAAGLTGDNAPVNGEDITEHHIRTALARALPTVEVETIEAWVGNGDRVPLPYAVAFDEVALVNGSRIQAVYL